MEHNDIHELKELFQYFYSKIMQDFYLSSFFSSFEQFPQLIDKQAKCLYEQLKERDKAIDYGKKIGNIHFKFRIQEDFMFDMLEYVKEKVKNLAFNNALSLSIENMDKVFLDFKNGNAISYINGILNESVKILDMLKESNRLIYKQLEFVKLLKKVLDNKDFENGLFQISSLKCDIANWFNTPAFLIISYSSKEIAPIIQFFHRNIHEFTYLVLEYLSRGDGIKALRMARIFSTNLYLFVLYTIYLFYEWDRNKEEIFFSFLSDPKFSDNIVTLVVTPSEKTLQKDSIFSEFSEKLVNYVNDVYGDTLFGFLLKNRIHFITYSYSSISDVVNIIKDALNEIEKQLKEDKEIEGVLKYKVAFIDVDMVKRNYSLNAFQLAIMFEIISEYTLMQQDKIFIYSKRELDEIYKKVLEIVTYECLIDTLLLNRRDKYCINYISGKERMEIFGQKIVSLTDFSTFGVECLVRILDDRVVIPAYKFISFIKQKELTKHLDLKVLSLINKYIDMAKKLKRIFINLFPTSYIDSEVIDTLRKINKKAKSKGISMVFEVTEYEAIDNRSIMNVLAKLDVDIALDDFGSGYTNLERVAEFSYMDNVKFLKVDGEILKHVIASKHHRHIVETTTFLAGKIGKDIIFEYVEDEKVLSLLKEIIKEVGFKQNAFVQGFLFSKPSKLEDFL